MKTSIILIVIKKGKKKKKQQRKLKEKQVLRPHQRTMEFESNSDINCNWCTVSKRFGKGTGRVGNQRMNRDHLNYIIFKINQNTENIETSV